MSQKIIIEKDIILPIYEKTHSINQTAKELNIGWSTCKRIFQEYGIETYKTSNQYGEYKEVERFNKIETREDAYWLGIIYSDGWIRSDRNSIGLGSIDEELIIKFKDYIGINNSIQIKDEGYNDGRALPEGRVCKHSKKFYSFEFSSKKTKENLIKLGCYPKKSLILQCPTKEQVPDKFLWDFLRGYIDGDGWVRYGVDKHRYTIGFLGTQHFLEGITSRLNINHYGTIKQKEEKTFTYSCDRKIPVEKILNSLYSDTNLYLKRKYLKCIDLFGRSPI